MFVVCIISISTVLIIKMKEHIVLTLGCIQLIQVTCNKNVVLMIADDFQSFFEFTCHMN